MEEPRWYRAGSAAPNGRARCFTGCHGTVQRTSLAVICAVAVAVPGIAVAAPPWSSPENVSSPALFVDNPDVVVPADGRALATWNAAIRPTPGPRSPGVAAGGARTGQHRVRPRARRAELRDAADPLRPRPRGRARQPARVQTRRRSRCAPASARSDGSVRAAAARSRRTTPDTGPPSLAAPDGALAAWIAKSSTAAGIVRAALRTGRPVRPSLHTAEPRPGTRRRRRRGARCVVRRLGARRRRRGAREALGRSLGQRGQPASRPRVVGPAAGLRRVARAAESAGQCRRPPCLRGRGSLPRRARVRRQPTHHDRAFATATRCSRGRREPAIATRCSRGSAGRTLLGVLRPGSSAVRRACDVSHRPGGRRCLGAAWYAFGRRRRPHAMLVEPAVALASSDGSATSTAPAAFGRRRVRLQRASLR